MNSVIFYGKNILTMTQPVYSDTVCVKKGEIVSVGEVNGNIDDETKEIYLGEGCLIPGIAAYGKEFADNITPLFYSSRGEFKGVCLALQRKYISQGITKLIFNNPIDEKIIKYMQTNGLILLDFQIKKITDTSLLATDGIIPTLIEYPGDKYSILRNICISPIKPGNKADFTVLSRNPITNSQRELRNLHVKQVYKNGMCIYDSVI